MPAKCHDCDSYFIMRMEGDKLVTYCGSCRPRAALHFSSRAKERGRDEIAVPRPPSAKRHIY